ncbi:catecholate siderophore receptor Fiu [Pseudorhodoferax sp.]|uniref:catecholate siderophore receptor Fiu n=1 Tax=Pseudorhodoferax sp. TaxID=1993553 RepID=UPI002DD64BA5|nr:catecholate siderophore receptor Fiu [Pseudorhodoferax sp.]
MSYITSRKHPRAGSAAAATLVAIALPVAAQTTQAPTAGTLREVKVQSTTETEYKPERVSSPKFTQPLVDTPQTITVIKKEVLRDQAATTLTDALRNTPGITMQMGENGNTATGDSVYLRGFDAQGSIFVDGIRDVGTITRDMFNIEQVEVVKGPAGTDIGRGSPNGYINLQSKVPFAENDANATVSLGSGSHKRTTLDLNRKLNESGSAAFRLNLMAQDSGVVDRDAVKNKGWGFAPSLALGLGTPTRTYFSYLHMNRRNRPDGGFVTTRLPGWSVAALGNARVPAVDESNFYGWASDHDNVDSDMFTARIEHDLAPGVTVRNITRWGRTKQDLVLTAPFSNGFAPNTNPADPASWMVRVLPQGKLQRNEVLANQTNITADLKLGGLDHSFSGGLELAREKQTNGTLAANINAGNGVLVGTAYQAFANLYSPDMGRPLVTVTPNGASTNGEVTTTAAYVFDTIKLNPSWQVNAGLRWEHYRTEYLSLPATGTTTGATSLSDSDNLFTGKVGVVYKPAANGSIYAAYATSARPPGSDFALSGTAGNANSPNMDPQKARTAELGTKWDVLDKRLALTAALFRTDNTNEVGTPDPVTGAVDQYGKTRVQGVEFSAIGQITPAWQLIAGLASTSAKVIEGARTGTTTGAAVRYSPKLTATLWSTYKLPFGLTVGGGARYVDTQARSTNTAAVAFVPEIPSYTVLDAMLGYEVNKNFSLQLNVFNLTDKFYIARINNAGNRATVGTPRSAVVTAKLQF